MNLLDIHLKFPDESTATKLMLDSGLLQEVTDDDGNVTNIVSQNCMVDIIGLIHKPTGKILKDNVPEFADVGGWHVNVRGDLPEIIKPYKITVTGTPYRIWD
jgi:hypothetical protein